MLNAGYALVKLFFRRNSPASATCMSHWCMIVAFSLRLQPLLPAELLPILLSRLVMS
jgi:hypothetical protein